MFDIHEGLEDTLSILHTEIKPDVTISKQYDDVPPVYCYPARLNQVFLNLLTNANEAIEGPGEITVSTYVRDGNVCITIKDTGKGISEQNQKRIFDPGFTTKDVGVGNGLGLAICYRIVQDHKGEIEVESKPGLGTSVTVALPLMIFPGRRDEAITSPTETQRRTQMDFGKRRFWIFDMDGTLTVPAHDFDAIRDELGLPQGLPILEQLADLPEEKAETLHRRLEEIELDIARDAVKQPGSLELLAELRSRGATVGILTRNSQPNALITLEACGLAEFFDRENVMTREMCTPKPSADGIIRLLDRWRATPEEAVMVGDFRFDILAGKEAGTATIFVDNHGKKDYAAKADKNVSNLKELLECISGKEN